MVNTAVAIRISIRLKARELIGRDVIANDGVLEIRPPINVHRAWDMAGVVEQDILVRFNDADVVIAAVF